MLSPFQQIVGVLPCFFVILAITILPVTQNIWLKRNYYLFILCFIIYSSISLWVFKFDLSSSGFKFSLFPFVYLGYCFLFEKIFLKIKFERTQRTFPIYVIFTDYGDDIWSKKINGVPESADRVVSGGLALATIFTILALMVFVL